MMTYPSSKQAASQEAGGNSPEHSTSGAASSSSGSNTSIITTFMDVAPELVQERRNASFSPASLTQLVDGGAAKVERRRWLRSLILADPIFSNEDAIYLNHTERYKRALAKCGRLDQLINTHGLSEEDGAVLRSLASEDLPTLLHDLMFLPCLLSLCSEEQQAYWVPLARSKKVLGCYAQTEMGHGSNIQALQTTATFDPATDEFVLDTPTIQSFKWWPGTLGRTANTAMVIARLLLPSSPPLSPSSSYQDLGIHNFIVPLRDLHTHALLPGVVARDIGPKVAFAGMDNGCLELHSVRIPRANLAQRFVRVSRDGVWSRVEGTHPKAAYVTMMQVRAIIVVHSARELSKAATIAIRYSAVRHQGYDADDSGPVKREHQILDYPSQQYRLLPLLAASIGFFFCGRAVQALLAETEQALLLGKKGQAEVGQQMGKAHASLAGLKSLCTTIAAEGIEDCRKCCGGHGYLACSGLPELSGNFLQQCTVEGDNVLLTQQTTGYLLKSYIKWRMGDGSEGERGGLDEDLWYFASASQGEGGGLGREGGRDVQIILDLFSRRAYALLERLALKLQGLTEGEGGKEGGVMSQGAAWKSVLVDVMFVSKAHSLYTILRHFAAGLQGLKEGWDVSGVGGVREGGAFVAVIERLFFLFAYYHLSRETGDFLELGLLSPEEAGRAREELDVLLQAVRPDAVGLCDGWDWSDFELKSTLGRWDGKYELALLESAKREPLNHQDVVGGWDRTWQPQWKVEEQGQAGRAKL
ncbi:acyl-oxidase [Nannochloropsis oceanica]